MYNQKQLLKLTSEKFNDIYTSEKFRNEVAHAHKCSDSLGNFKHLKTCSYPIEYIVSAEQKVEAEAERQRAKTEAVKNVGNRLVFVAMGCDYEPRFKDDVCNHRIRTEFKNKDGRLFFIEVGTGRGDEMRVDFAIDRDLEQKYDRYCAKWRNKRNQYKTMSKEWRKCQIYVNKYMEQPYYNYNGLERSHLGLKYTKQNVLNFVNKHFDCSFTKMEVDGYNLSPDDFICNSPKS